MKLLYCTIFMMSSIGGMAQKSVPLYETKIPGSKSSPDEEQTEFKDGFVRISKISVPTLTIYQADKRTANGTAVIIFPGGGYSINAMSHEGTDVAQKFNEMGVTAFVVKYRIPNDKTMDNKEIGPLQDAQRAIQFVREHAEDWKINPGKIGIMGFSAGGHLASTLGTHFKTQVIDNPKQTSLRPDFMILLYPVINLFDSVAHLGSRNQLLGKSPTAQKISLYSNDVQVTSDTPPTFLVHASDDKAVPVKNSLLFYESLVKHHVPAELHIYQNGGHGFGMNNKTSSDKWFDRLTSWMKDNEWLN